MENIRLYKGDCLEVMKIIPDKSVDMILCDLPYGTTSCKWDTIIDLDLMWKQYNRIIKDNGAIVLTASQPFTSKLVMSNPKMFRHEWIYKKKVASNFAQAKYAPLKEHESVLVFSKKRANYFPIKEERKGGGKGRIHRTFNNNKYDREYLANIKNSITSTSGDDMRYPSSVQEFNNRANGDTGLHPTQKPVTLLEYLIKTYTNEGEVVLDNCMGSGSTGVACVNTNRKFIGIELDEKYFDIAKKRIEESLE